MTTAADWFHRSCQYEFTDADILERALTHRSVGGANNERLEFLGDAILGFVVADLLYAACPDASEGHLSRLRARLVRGETLAELAGAMGVGDWLRLGPGELKSGGFRRDSILANAFEALIGAVYLDGGYPAARSLVERFYTGYLEDLPSAEELKDAKTRLQELLQARGIELPEYVVDKEHGRAHERTFEVSCRVAALDQVTHGRARSRRGAEQAAAERMLEALGDDPRP